MTFKEITDEWHREQGGEGHVRSVDDTCWISVLHRMTGFGYMEWETAICFCDPENRQHITGSPFIVRGDWRDELENMPREELMTWFHEKRRNNPISMDAAIGLLKAMCDD